jgi:hypothetical protein
MPFINQGGKLVRVTEAEYVSLTGYASNEAQLRAAGLTEGTFIANQLYIPGTPLSQQQLSRIAAGLAIDPSGYDSDIRKQYESQIGKQTQDYVPVGGTQTVNNTATTPIATLNTTNNTPGQTLVTTSATVSRAAASVDPATSLAPGETIVTDGNVNSNTAVSAADSGFVETSPGVFQAAEDLPVDPATDPTAGGGFVQQADGSFVAAEDLPITDINGEAASPTEDPNVPQEVSAVTTERNTGTGTSADSAAASANIQGLVKGAQAQKTIADQRKQINNGDWRVRLRLAPQAKYLYNAANPGILKPLQVTDGIIFPYTPQISTAYRAQYSPYDLTHSNYRGYFYQNSFVDAINLTATFTAQDTNDANYLLAVIHFLRSATKMFYGQDAERGSPPPVVYLSGLGDYQFREHSCLISQFQYNLPAEVDYIRAGSPNNAGLNFNNIRDRQSVATNSIFNSVNRLAAAFLTKGAITGSAAPPTLGLNRPTYVPTKMEIQLTLLPIQSRQQVSKQFSLKEFANGNLLKGGFW